MPTLELTGDADPLLEEIANFIAAQQLAVVATLGRDGAPQAALVGAAITDRFELIFDSLDTSRKVVNLRRDHRVAFVVGGTMQDERTVQVDGIADEPVGDEAERVREAYFRRWPDGRQRQTWAGITHVRITPHWVRFSDWNVSPVVVVEWAMGDDGVLTRT